MAQFHSHLIVPMPGLEMPTKQPKRGQASPSPSAAASLIGLMGSSMPWATSRLLGSAKWTPSLSTRFCCRALPLLVPAPRSSMSLTCSRVPAGGGNGGGASTTSLCSGLPSSPSLSAALPTVQDGNRSTNCPSEIRPEPPLFRAGADVVAFVGPEDSFDRVRAGTDVVAFVGPEDSFDNVQASCGPPSSDTVREKPDSEGARVRAASTSRSKVVCILRWLGESGFSLKLTSFPRPLVGRSFVTEAVFDSMLLLFLASSRKMTNMPHMMMPTPVKYRTQRHASSPFKSRSTMEPETQPETIMEPS
mmetsp:Transcript_40099/g.128661  ORF Transcript_40099/g.128661 Transcript_40099/m.128661 type:complete len:304 (+) Transcript_40099:83-994(+)